MDTVLLMLEDAKDGSYHANDAAVEEDGGTNAWARLLNEDPSSGRASASEAVVPPDVDATRPPDHDVGVSSTNVGRGAAPAREGCSIFPSWLRCVACVARGGVDE